MAASWLPLSFLDRSAGATDQGTQQERQTDGAIAFGLDGSTQLSDADLLRSGTKDLPPCYAIIQVAYENVVNELRKRWLYRHGEESIADTCRFVHSNLSNQNLMWPLLTRARERNKRNIPWRRRRVFEYELRWIEYFVREAETTGFNLEQDEQFPIPKELGLQCEKSDVLKMWETWLKKRRANPLSARSGTHSPHKSGEAADMVDGI
ncbi:hypothetical protein N0V90_001560 [Kalmusia sp. IMI 367209]|nr:hypothetical protein N0V90_001560 [Kalmusia sp. IMI 367209]